MGGEPFFLGDLKALYKRISKAREIIERADRACAENWRRGTMDQTAVVQLEDERVSYAKLHGDTCAFGTSNGAVLIIDLVEGDIIDGYDGHVGEVTALEWNGAQLLSGGVDGMVRVFQPRPRREEKLFELMDVEEDYDDADDDLSEQLLLKSWRSAMETCEIMLFDGTSSSEAEAAMLARAPLYRSLCSELSPSTHSDDAIIITAPHAPSIDEKLGGVEYEDDSISLQGHSSRVTGVRVSNGIVYSCSLDKQIVAWDLESRKGRLLATTQSAVCCLAIAGNLAIVGLLNGGVAAYTLDSGELAFEIPEAHDGAVRALHVNEASLSADYDSSASLDGRLLVTGGMDGIVKCFTMQQLEGAVRPLPIQPTLAHFDNHLHRRRRRRVGAHSL